MGYIVPGNSDTNLNLHNKNCLEHPPILKTYILCRPCDTGAKNVGNYFEVLHPDPVVSGNFGYSDPE
jgi:hypothetical protein